MASVASALDTSVAYLMGETDDSRRNAEPQSVNAMANGQSSTATAIGSIDRQNTITLAPLEAKTNVTVEGKASYSSMQANGSYSQKIRHKKS
jgi:hypothetical protein